MSKDKDITAEELLTLKEIFLTEARELLEEYSQYVLEVERSEAPGESLKVIERAVHTLKGISMTVELDDLAELAHRLEDLLVSLRNSIRSFDRSLIDLLLACGDTMSKSLDCYAAEPPKPGPGIAPLCQRLAEALASHSVKAIEAPSSPANEPSRSQASSPPLNKRYRLTITFVRYCRMHSAGMS